MTAGPSVTRNSAGKIKNTSGNTSLTEVLAASPQPPAPAAFAACQHERAGSSRRWCQIAPSAPAWIPGCAAVHAGAVRHVLPGFGAGAPGALLQHHDAQFVAQLGLRTCATPLRCAPSPGPGSGPLPCRSPADPARRAGRGESAFAALRSSGPARSPAPEIPAQAQQIDKERAQVLPIRSPAQSAHSSSGATTLQP